jgi:hypothetical protein
MQKLIFVSFFGVSWASRLIRAVTRSMGTSHIAVWDTEKETLIEAWGGVSLCWRWSNFKNHTPGTQYEVWELDVDDKVYNTCMETYRKWADMGHPYDYIAILGFILRMRRENIYGDFCSEGAVRPLALALGWTKITPAFISPADFIALIQAAGGRLLAEKKSLKGRLNEFLKIFSQTT